MREAEVGSYRVEVMETGIPGMSWVHVWDTDYSDDKPAASMALSQAVDMADAIREAASMADDA